MSGSRSKQIILLACTLRGRIRKKLLDPVTRYKSKPDKDDEEVEMVGKKSDDQVRTRKRKHEDEKYQKEGGPQSSDVLLLHARGDLAKRLREVEDNMEKNNGYRIKIVEEAGEKILDILHSSHPWKEKDVGCVRPKR